MVLFIGLPSIASAEMWRCALPDGTDIYTNNPKEYQGCQAHQPVAELSIFYPAADRGPTARLPVTSETLKSAQPAPRENVDEISVPSDMPFEVYRMLSIGMSEAEVLARAGAPTFVSGLPLAGGSGLIAPVSNALRYSYLGDWIVVVEFDRSGRLSNLDRFRPRP